MLDLKFLSKFWIHLINNMVLLAAEFGILCMTHLDVSNDTQYTFFFVLLLAVL